MQYLLAKHLREVKVMTPDEVRHFTGQASPPAYRPWPASIMRLKRRGFVKLKDGNAHATQQLLDTRPANKGRMTVLHVDWDKPYVDPLDKMRR
jgi:hypothetical protein